MKKTHLFLASIGFVGALPMPLIGSVLSVRLREIGFDITTIGLFSLFHLPFALKPLLAPFIEKLSPPPPFSWMERMEGWLLFSLLLNLFTLIGIAFYPTEPLLLLLLSGAAGLLYVTGLQVEISLVPLLGQMEASASVVGGYRLGLLTAGGGALLLAEGFGWEISYLLMAFLLLLPFLFRTHLPTLSEENRGEKKPISFITPLKNLLNKGLPLFLFLIFYRLGDDLADPMLKPFFLDLGFTKVEIAEYSKGLGMGATLLGVATAGWSKGLPYPLLLFGSLHAVSFLLFAFLQPTTLSFATSVLFEHFSGGLIITAFIATLWKEVTPGFGTTQYALLWSLLALKKNLVGSVSGYLAIFLGWPLFFTLITAISLLGALFSLPLQLTTRKALPKI